MTFENRNYKVSDAEMLSAADTFLIGLQDFYAPLAALDPTTFNDTFVADYTTAIAEAENMPSDNVMIDKQAKESKDVELAMDICLDEVRFLRYYVRKSYAPRSETYNAFGYNDLNDSRQSADKLLLFMLDITQAVTENLTTLMEKNYPSMRASTLTEATMRLKQERFEQKRAKLSRNGATIQRTHLMNSVWNSMVLVNDASNYCLEDNALAMKTFALPTSETVGF